MKLLKIIRKRNLIKKILFVQMLMNDWLLNNQKIWNYTSDETRAYTTSLTI